MPPTSESASEAIGQSDSHSRYIGAILESALLRLEQSRAQYIDTVAQVGAYDTATRGHVIGSALLASGVVASGLSAISIPGFTLSAAIGITALLAGVALIITSMCVEASLRKAALEARLEDRAQETAAEVKRALRQGLGRPL